MRNINTFFKSLLFIASVIMMHTNSKAATYTAILSGNFSSSSTWSGGLVPPSICAGDLIIIPNTINVTLDQNTSLTAGADLLVNGTLTGANGYFISMTSGTISGAGTIDIDSFHAGFTSGFNFIGDLMVDAFHNIDATFATAADVTVNESLHLDDGDLDIGNGTFTLGNMATITVSGGAMAVSGGSIYLNNGYHVVYVDASANGGVELSGSGLTNITINVPSSSSVSLNADLQVDGMLTLNSGTLNLNGNNLMFGATGNLSATGSGRISSSTNSDISINTNGSLAGSLKFTTGGNTVDDFTINLGNSSASVMIDDNLQVTGQLNLQNGRLNIGTNKLELMTNATLTGGSANSFVVTGNGGRLAIDVAANGSKTFHVGTSSNYAPATITLSSSSSNSKFSVGVYAQVKSSGTGGITVSDTQPVVNATWFSESSTTANVNASLETFWNTNMEVNGFDRTRTYISSYNGSNNPQWDATAVQPATTNSNGMHSVKRHNIPTSSTLAPYAVFDENTAVSVGNVVAIAGWELYPNPATNVITITLKDHTQAARANFYNTSGQLVHTVEITGEKNAIDITHLSSGLYYIRMDGAFAQAGHKFIKQ